MKKLISYMLIALMVFSFTPSKTFARSDNYVTKTVTAADDGKLITESTAPYLYFDVDDNTKLKDGDTANLTLTGSKWNLGDVTTSAAVNVITGKTTATLTPKAGSSVTLAANTTYVYPDLHKMVVTGNITSQAAVVEIFGNTAATTTFVQYSAAADATAFINYAQGTSFAGGTFANDTIAAIQIPLFTEMTAAGNAQVSVQSNANISSGTYTFAYAASGSTLTVIDDQDDFTDVVNVGQIIIQEMSANKLDRKDNTKITLKAPAGFEFNDPTTVKVRGTDGLKNVKYVSGNAVVTNDTKMVITIDTSTCPETKGNLVIDEGQITLQSTDSAKPNTKVMLSISGAGMTAQSDLFVANYVEAGAKLIFDGDDKLADFNITGGKWAVADGNGDGETARFQLVDNSARSWSTGKSFKFNVSSNTKITAAEVAYDNLVNASGTGSSDGDFIDPVSRTTIIPMGATTDKTDTNGSAYIKVNSDSIEVFGFKGDPDDLAKLTVKLYVTTDATSSDPVKVTSNAPGLLADFKDAVTVATTVAPLSVTADSNSIGLGKGIQTSDIVITENVAGALGDGVTVQNGAETYGDEKEPIYGSSSATKNVIDQKSVTTNADGYIVITPELGFTFDRSAAVTATVNSGDVELGTPIVGSNAIKIEVKGTSEDGTPSKMTISGVKVVADRTVVTGSYALFVGGSAVASNTYTTDTSSKFDSTFSSNGIEIANYLKVNDSGIDGSQGPNGDRVIKATVNFESGAYTLPDGTTGKLDPAPYLDENNRTLMPLRAVATLLGVPDENIVWDKAARTVTINYNGNEVIFTIGSAKYVVNGEVLSMDTTAVINNKSSRTYLPLKYLTEGIFGGQAIYTGNSTAEIWY